MNHEIIDIVKGLISRVAEAANPGDGDSLVRSGLLDSVDVEELAWELERAFSIEVPPREISLENFETPRALAAMVERLKAARAGEGDPPPRRRG